MMPAAPFSRIASFPIPPNNDITSVLRRANAHYTYIASRFRASLRKTNHARKHAAALNLNVDIVKAVHCEQRYVSQIPLPILDTNPSPAPVLTPPPSAQYDEMMVVADGLDSPYAPALRCTIPTNVIAATELRSGFSADSEYSAAAITSPVSSPVGIQGAQCFLGDGMSPITDEDEDFRAVAMASHSVRRETGRGRIPVIAPRPIRLRLAEVPTDVNRLSWNWQDGSDMEISSSSSTSGSSNGLITPDGDDSTDSETRLVIRIKRKSVILDDIDFDVLEKRPKFERKEWIQITNGQRRNIIRIPSMRR